MSNFSVLREMAASCCRLEVTMSAESSDRKADRKSARNDFVTTSSDLGVSSMPRPGEQALLEAGAGTGVVEAADPVTAPKPGIRLSIVSLE